MIEKYHNPIYEAISQANQPLGVNEIAKITEIPLSTVQRYLANQQRYFKKTEDRKWDLPERVNKDITETSHSVLLKGLEASIQIMQSQIKEMDATLSNALTPLDMLKRSIETKPLPVANKVQNEVLKTVLDATEKLPILIKKKKENINEEDYKVLSKVQWLDIYLIKGTETIRPIEEEIYSIIMGEREVLSDEVYELLKEYQQ